MTTLKTKPIETLRSLRWFAADDFRAFGHRQRAQQMGLRREEFMGRPVVAIGRGVTERLAADATGFMLMEVLINGLTPKLKEVLALREVPDPPLPGPGIGSLLPALARAITRRRACRSLRFLQTSNNQRACGAF